MVKKSSRRDFLKKSAAVSGLMVTGLFSAALHRPVKSLLQQTPTPAAYLPIIMKITPETPAGNGKVVRVSSSSATTSGSGYYYIRVNQSVVNNMVDQGVMRLTGKTTLTEAWGAIIPGYQAGKIIAVKVNFNNTSNCSGADNNIDALPQPVVAMVRGLVQHGVRQQDILIFDATRRIPSYFSDTFHANYPNVKFYDNYNGTCHNLATFSTNTDGEIIFQKSAIPKDHLPSLMLSSTYLINVPIMKYHPLAGVTLGMKNHLGCIRTPSGLHLYTEKVRGGASYSSTFNPLVDINNHAAIRTKTVLILGDALFANWVNNTDAPQTWNIFNGKYPNSLFFSTDPVAVDCVMADYVRFERDSRSGFEKVNDWAYDYLRLAKDAGLGIYEKRISLNSAYSTIAYFEYAV